MPEVLTVPSAHHSLMVPETASTSSNDSPRSTKSRRFIKFSPRLRKKSRSGKDKEKEKKEKENNAVTSGKVSMMASGGDHPAATATVAADHCHPQMPNGLNDKEKQELQSIFDMFDKNKDGKISCEELGVVLRTLGHRYTQQEVEEMISNADKNENGFVEYDEFLLLMKRWSANVADQDEEALEAESAREAFRAFDVDGNGYIDRHELRFIMSRLPQSPGEKDIDDRDIDQMFRLADLNGDGLIDYEEFTQLMANMPLVGGGGAPPSSSTSSSRSPASSSSSSKASSSKSVKKK